MIRVGDKFPLNCGSVATVIEYINCDRVKIITNTGYKTFVRAGKLRDGNVKDKLFRTSFRIGFLGIGKYDTYHPSNKVWLNMLQRSYYMNNKGSVSNDWHNFQNFAKHYDKFYIDGYQLDKDLLFYKNEQYSSDKCIYVPSKINSLFRTVKSNGLPYGVMHYKNFYSSSIQPRKEVLSEIEAHNNYWNDKYEKTLDLCEIYPKFKNILLNYFEQLINDKYYNTGE